MNWNRHLELRDHAIFSPSQSSWLRYSDDKLIERFLMKDAAMRGTRLHAHAKDDILFGEEFNILRPANGRTYETYVNDGIKYRMQPEQPLFYSENFWGTADTISFKRNFLRIHDLKTGAIPAEMDQLMVYAALFCLEYKQKPGLIKMELRIYQNNEVKVCNPTVDDILPIMDKIQHFDDLIKQHQLEDI